MGNDTYTPNPPAYIYPERVPTKNSKEYNTVKSYAALNKDGTVMPVDHNIQNFDHDNRVAIYIAIGATIPKGTKPGTVVYEAVDPTAHGADMQIKYEYYYKYKNPPVKVKLKSKPPTRAQVLNAALNLGLGKFNPPPHKASRSISPTAFSNYSLSSGASVDTISTLQRARARGYIIQDVDNATDASGNPKVVASDLWGFQFMYNPKSLSYSVTNASFDPTNTADIANNLTGSQQISVDIFLNRLMDIPALSQYYDFAKDVTLSSYNTGAQQTLTDPDYFGSLSGDDIKGIVTRGTEWDLEYLYRTVNGEPTLGPLTTIPTSDFGYLSSVPVWFKFHDNMKYKVSISGIQVEHVMFNENMVPVMTNVSISMIRIPMPAFDDDATASFFGKRLTKKGADGKAISNQPTYGIPADTTATSGN